MDGPTIYGVTTGSIGTLVSLFLVYRMVTSERPNLLPYITDWESTMERHGHLIIKLRVVVQNKSKAANTVEHLVLKARDERDFCFRTGGLTFLSDGKAYVAYKDGNLEYLCSSKDVLQLPANIGAKQSISGRLGFSIGPEYAEKARKQAWGIKVFDQGGNGFLSTRDRDQTIPA